MTDGPCDIAFTPTIRAEQERRGSRARYARVEAQGGFRSDLSEFPHGFLARVDTAFLGTANLDGQPYVQHRGGPPGFIRIADDHHLVLADFRGNRQYISTGNLTDNPKAFLFLMDYENRHRIKLWGRARMSADIASYAGVLGIDPADRSVEQVLVFEVEAWDVNCQAHIPQKVDAAAAARVVLALRARLEAVEAENAELRELLKPGSHT